MLHHALKAAIALAFGALIVNPAAAVPLIPPTTVLGNFVGDDDAQQFEFSIASDSIVTIETVSYAGGALVGFGGTVVPGGGFDPILSLFDGDGLFITAQDDGSSNVDAGTGAAFDSFFQPALAAGTYTVVITQFNNFFNGGVGDPLSNGFDVTGAPNFTAAFGCAAGQFCDVTSDSRSNQFAINISAEALAVPEPAALALLGFGLVGVGMAYRRRR